VVSCQQITVTTKHLNTQQTLLSDASAAAHVEHELVHGQAGAVCMTAASIVFAGSASLSIMCTTSHILMHRFMLCSGSIDYATPQDQQFQFDYDLSMQNDQRSRSPAASPVRHVMKRPRHAAGEQQAGTSGTPFH
jgi:hypothetical protein